MAPRKCTRRSTPYRYFSAAPACLLAFSTGAAAAGFTIGVGSEYTAGTYGSLDKTNIFSVPMYAKYWTGPFTLRVSASWLRVTGPGTIIPSGIGGIGVSGGASISDGGFAGASATTGVASPGGATQKISAACVGGSSNGCSGGGGGTSPNSGPGSVNSGGGGGSTNTGGGGTNSGGSSTNSGGGGTNSGGGGTNSGGGGTNSGSGGTNSGSGSTNSGGGTAVSGTGATTPAATSPTSTTATAAAATTSTTSSTTTSTTTSSNSGGAAAAAVRRTQEGFSDLVAALTYNAVNTNGFYLDVTGKIKVATASESRGLGSGKNDYALQFDGEKSFGATFITAGIGNKWLGDAVDNSLHRVWYGAAGVGHKISADNTLGVSYNYTKSAQVDGQPAKEAVVYYSHRIDKHFRLNANVLKGLSDGNADWGAGMSIAYNF